MKRPVLGLLFSVYWLTLTCQIKEWIDVSDSLIQRLNEVVIVSDIMDPFVLGPIEQLAIQPSDLFLADALDQSPSIYFKNYGNQQLSTVSFRGTSASQTNVLWHGVPLNLPTLGQTDFSTWPVWLMDNISAQAGNSGSLYGSGALGGTIIIDNQSQKNTPGIDLYLRQGSFGNLSTGLKGAYKSGNISGKSSLYWNSIENDFKVNPTGFDEPIRQQNAQVESYGFAQDLYYQTENQRLGLHLIHHVNDRKIQPSIFTQNVSNRLKTTNTRIAAEHQVTREKWLGKTTGSFIQDETIYNQTDTTPSTSWSFLHRSRINLGVSSYLLLGTLIQSNRVTSQQHTQHTNQNILEPFGGWTWYPALAWEFTGSVRTTMMNQQNSGLIPSFAIAWKPAYYVKISSSWSQAYRYPTLNDLYWNPGGNTNLQPEQSQQIEINTEWQIGPLSLTGTVYHMQSEDHIIWLPVEAGIWSPRNIRSAENTGVELSYMSIKNFERLSWNSKGQVSYTRAVFKSSADPTIIVGNQLPYVPNWLADWSNQLDVKDWSFGLDQSWTSDRFTTVDASDRFSLPAFYLLDLWIEFRVKSEKHQKQSIKARLAINNMLNTYYELQENLAMPGINYSLTINYQIK